jgi:hypothetical protein
VITATEIGPSLHNLVTAFETIRSPISSFYRISDLMAQSLLKQVAGEAGVFAPRPERCPKAVRGDRPSAFWIDPPWFAVGLPVHFLEQGEHCHVA